MPAESALSAPVTPASPIPPVRTIVPYVQSAIPQNLSTAAPAAPPATRPSPRAPASDVTPTYVLPKPVRKTTVKLPVETVLGNPLEVPIKVEIDATGKVTKATPVQVNATNYAVVQPALRAAASWEFVPAQQNGRPVPSEMVITFQFESK
jgi:periplasmic protein TonB